MKKILFVLLLVSIYSCTTTRFDCPAHDKNYFSRHTVGAKIPKTAKLKCWYPNSKSSYKF